MLAVDSNHKGKWSHSPRDNQNTRIFLGRREGEQQLFQALDFADECTEKNMKSWDVGEKKKKEKKRKPNIDLLMIESRGDKKGDLKVWRFCGY